MFFVTEENPRKLDEQFLELFPALGLRATSNSGAFWGDGDLRPAHTDYGALQFALESKARFSDRYKNTCPRPDEWEKAMGTPTTVGQLRRRNRSAVRLFLVYLAATGEYGVSIPEEDARQLSQALGVEVCGERRTLRRRGALVGYIHLDPTAWVELYNAIESKLGQTR